MISKNNISKVVILISIMVGLSQLGFMNQIFSLSTLPCCNNQACTLHTPENRLCDDLVSVNTNYFSGFCEEYGPITCKTCLDLHVSGYLCSNDQNAPYSYCYKSDGSKYYGQFLEWLQDFDN